MTFICSIQVCALAAWMQARPKMAILREGIVLEGMMDAIAENRRMLCVGEWKIVVEP